MKPAKTSRGALSRQKILDTCSRLIAENGANNTTLDHIATACNIAKSSILWHFGSKEELFIEVVDSVYRLFADRLVTRQFKGLGVSDKVRLFFREYHAVSTDRPEIPRIFFSFALSSEKQEKIKDKIERIYEWNRAAYMTHLDISPSLAAILVGMVNGVLIQWITAPDKIDIKTLFEEMIPIFIQLIETEHQS